MRHFLFLSLCFLSLTACDRILLPTETPNKPIPTFDALWTSVAKQYGLFPVKSLDWDSVYSIYRPQLTENSTDAELFGICREMLSLLDDSHVALVPTQPDLPFFQGGIYGRLDSMKDFNLELVKAAYLPDANFADPFFTYGILEGNIGYLHIEGFSDLPRFLAEPMQAVMAELADTKGLIIDVRGGYGGEDLAGQFIAGHFATESLPYMKTRVKSGPEADDFSDWEEWHIQPEGEQVYLKPIMVLTHRFTISARETFCLAMNVLPQVQFVGDTTTGAFSNQINHELPNGWGYSLSIGDWRDATGRSYESLGLPPDVVVQNRREEVLQGRDAALEKAMELLQ